MNEEITRLQCQVDGLRVELRLLRRMKNEANRNIDELLGRLEAVREEAVVDISPQLAEAWEKGYAAGCSAEATANPWEPELPGPPTDF